MTSTERRLRLRPRDESGSSLLIALAVMVVMGVVVASLANYAMANHKATVVYRTVRQKRYAGEAAINQLVNWAKDQPETGTDPDLPINHPACVTQVPVTIKGVTTTVTASCAAEAGKGSGTPNDTGLTPPEGMVLLGQRQAEPGPFNAPPCTGWWDKIKDFFDNLFNSGSILNQNDGLDIVYESGARFKNRTASGTLGATCDTRNRGEKSIFKIKGDMVAAGRMESSGYTVSTVDPDGSGPLTGTLRARAGCNFSPCTTTIPNRSGFTSASSYLNGTAEDTDPGRATPSSPTQNPQGNTAAPWLSVAFKNDGTLRDLGYTATSLMPNRLPVRTSAYQRDPITGAITALSSNTCPSSSTTIVFLPGWYKNASLLNDFTTGATCKDATLWFGPDPGPDSKLLTADDRTGAFYFDFDTGSGAAQNCNNLGASKYRWCVGGSRTSAASSDQSPRIVVGTPDGWTPRSAGSNGALDPLTTYRVSIDNAATVDDDLSQTWSNGANAKVIDGNVATYSANRCIPWLNWCFSQDRAIRVRDFTPDVTSPPVDQGSAAPRGRIYLRVRYAVKNPTSVDVPQAVIEAVAPDSPRKSCGTFNLDTNKAAADAGGGPSPTLHDYVFTDAQAKSLADACGSVDLINGLEVKIQIKGNTLNQPKADWYLDGVQIYFDSFDNAHFPQPNGNTDPKAKGDCDPAKPGGQFIFGGQSHMYVADGSVELCAGPFPLLASEGSATLNDKQSIGVWAMPAVGEVGPSGVSGGSNTASLSSTGNIFEIDGQTVRQNYNACGLFECTTRDAAMNINMNGYTAPTGYVIQKVTTRLAYNPRSQCAPIVSIFCARPNIDLPSGNAGCGQIDLNKINGVIQAANQEQFTVYDAATGRNCLNIGGSQNSFSGSTFTYHARCAFWCVGGSYDLFDGIKYQVTLAPAGSAAVALPQTGCIVAHPNYGYGGNSPDCAVIRSDLSRNDDNWSAPWDTKENGDSRGRISVKGTIYAPSSAIEIDDTDLAYPLSTRGAVLRHLRVSGFRFRSGYDAPAIDNTVDRRTSPREAIFTACISTPAHLAARAPCQAGDQMLTRARVRFEIDPTTAVAPERRARIPKIVAWTDVI